MYEICKGTQADKDEVLRVLWKAFQVLTDFETLKKEDWVKHWADEEFNEYAYIAKYNEKPVGNLAFFISNNSMIRGSSIPIAGVWGVTTLPEHRKRGLVKKISERAFPAMREKGAILSILDPFLIEFYEQFGYALAETRVCHEFRYHDIKPFSATDEITSRELKDTNEASKLTEIERSMARLGSRLFHRTRTLESMIKTNHFHILEKESGPVGMVKFDFKRLGSSEDMEDHLLKVSTSSYISDDVFPAIMELVRNYAVNVHHVRWWCDIQQPVQNYMRDAWAPKTLLDGSMMMRVVDFEKFCRSIRVPKEASESVIARLVDQCCPWNEGTYKLTPSDKTLDVEVSGKEPDVSITPLALSKMIGGRIGATLLRSLGEIECSFQTASRLEHIFPLDNFMSYPRF